MEYIRNCRVGDKPIKIYRTLAAARRAVDKEVCVDEVHFFKIGTGGLNTYWLPVVKIEDGSGGSEVTILGNNVNFTFK